MTWQKEISGVMVNKETINQDHVHVRDPAISATVHSRVSVTLPKETNSVRTNDGVSISDGKVEDNY